MTSIAGSELRLVAALIVVCACKGESQQPDATLRLRPVDAPVARRPDASHETAACPRRPEPPPEQSAWLFAAAQSPNGTLLMAEEPPADIYVRDVGADLPGLHASPDGPCAVASYATSTRMVTILATAPGFTSRQVNVPPQTCTNARPCTVALARTLPAVYYASTPGHDRLLSVHELPTTVKREDFAAAVAKDAVERSKTQKLPLAHELDRASRATKIPSGDLAVSYVETHLGQRCTQRCVDDPRLDAPVRDHLKQLLSRGWDPFRKRVPPGEWGRGLHPPPHP